MFLRRDRLSSALQKAAGVVKPAASMGVGIADAGFAQCCHHVADTDPRLPGADEKKPLEADKVVGKWSSVKLDGKDIGRVSLDEGSEMRQFSVYVRHCSGKEEYAAYARRTAVF